MSAIRWIQSLQPFWDQNVLVVHFDDHGEVVEITTSQN